MNDRLACPIELPPGSLTGGRVIIIAGPRRGEFRNIAAHDKGVVTLHGEWDIEPGDLLRFESPEAGL